MCVGSNHAFIGAVRKRFPWFVNNPKTPTTQTHAVAMEPPSVGFRVFNSDPWPAVTLWAYLCKTWIVVVCICEQRVVGNNVPTLMDEVSVLSRRPRLWCQRAPLVWPPNDQINRA